MISGIDSQADITVYLEAGEVERLQAEKLEGVLVKILKPKRQGKLFISVNDSRKNQRGFGIGVDDTSYWGVKDDFEVELFMGNEWYQYLKEHGKVGLRQRMLDGSKVHIYDISRLDNIDAMVAENLKFYRDNKDKLPADFG